MTPCRSEKTLGLSKPCAHILITGTSTGIGRACAARLAREGFIVWAGVRTEEDGRSVEEMGKGAGGEIRSLQLDVTDISSIRAAEKEIRARAGEGGLYGIVNNAGICVVGPVEFISLEEWRQQFDVNVFGAIAVTQIMMPLLRAHCMQGGGVGARIVNMGSITGEISTPLFGAYSASKFALRAMNDALRLEVKAEGIHVCLIVPGTIESEIWRKERQSVDAIPSGSPARRHYGLLIDKVAGYVFGCAKKALPAQCVADAVLQCFTAVKPRIQYRVGWEAQIGSRAKKLLPNRLFDWLLVRTMGVPRKRVLPSAVAVAAIEVPV